jgi:RNA polymerase sigma-B factor
VNETFHGELDDAALRYAEGRKAGVATPTRDEFITAAVPFADRLASRYRGRGLPLEDLCQVARLALVKAVDKLDPERGSFTAYAATTVRGELRRYFRNAGWDVRVPRPAQELVLDLWRVVDDLTQDLARTPTRAELSRALGCSTAELEASLQAASAYTARSLNAPAPGGDGGADGAELGDLLGATDPDLDGADDRLTMRHLVRRLPPREQRILALRFHGNLSQAEIAEATGVSQMHVSRLLTRTLSWLRESMLSDEPIPWPGIDDERDLTELVIGVVNEGGIVAVAVRGEIDADSAARLRSVLEFYSRRAAVGVRVDMRRVPFVDAAGAAAFASAYGVALSRRVTFQIVHAGPTVRHSLTLAGLGGILARLDA